MEPGIFGIYYSKNSTFESPSENVLRAIPNAKFVSRFPSIDQCRRCKPFRVFFVSKAQPRSSPDPIFVENVRPKLRFYRIENLRQAEVE